MKEMVLILLALFIPLQYISSGYSDDTKRTKVITTAKKYIGTDYHAGGSTPEKGFDCSGFVMYVFDKVGIELPRMADAQFFKGKAVNLKNAKPGDLVFFKINGTSISHVGIYLGNNTFIHSPRAGRTVSIADMNIAYWKKRFAGARRYF